MNQHKEELHEEELTIGISIGDYNGVGPEVIIKTLMDNRVLRQARIVIYGSTRILGYYRKVLKLSNFNYQTIQTVEEARSRKINVINVNQDNPGIEPGEVTQEAGQFAFVALEAATKALKSGEIDALVTAPINKKNIQSEDFSFPGHTEYLTTMLEASESLMLMVSDRLRVGVVTGHIPLHEVAGQLNAARIRAKVKVLKKSLMHDFGIPKPRIAVMGLNPHAGEEGLLGTEEQEFIAPTIQEMRQEGTLVFGPYPADGFFGKGQYTRFDGVIAMYHDQGLAPFKTIASGAGVNYTAGLTGVRTSPDHGTAYDIAGKGTADENSFRQALFQAINICKARRGEQLEVYI